MESTSGPATRTPFLLPSAIALGFLADGLLRVFPWGLNAAVWLTALVLTASAQADWRSVKDRRAVYSLFAATLMFAAAAAGRASPVLAVANLSASVACLFLASLALRGGVLHVAGFTEYVLGILAVGRDLTLGPIPHVQARVQRGATRFANLGAPAIAIGRGLAIGLPLFLTFGALFVAADAAFARLARDTFTFDVRSASSHAAWTVSGAWLAGGFLWQAAAAPALPPRSDSEPPPGLRLGPIEITTSLGGLNLLFLAFVLVQARYLFGGHTLVERSLNLTYSQYARRGFYELLAVAALVLPVLLIANWLLDRRAKHSLRLFSALGATLVALLAVIMISALKRLRVLEDTYGLTELRLYAFAFMVWLGIVLVIALATVLRGRSARFWSLSLVAALAVVAVLNFVNPDAVIVQRNVARLDAGHSFDLGYALRLSDDAVPALVAALASLPADQSCQAATALLNRQRGDRGDPRTWTYGHWHARAVLTENAAYLAGLCPR